MSAVLPPGNFHLPSSEDQAHDIALILQNETWPDLWPQIIHRYATEAARNADLAGVGSSNRAYAEVDALGCLTRWNGTAWVRMSQGLLAVASGAIDFMFAGGYSVTHTATFPSGRFTVPPIVTPSVFTNLAVVHVQLASAPTTTSVDIRVCSTDATAITGTMHAYWTAMQTS